MSVLKLGISFAEFSKEKWQCVVVAKIKHSHGSMYEFVKHQTVQIILLDVSILINECRLITRCV